ncbi:hypothetical protein SERLA73DRAFT_190279 [Serpula lacrymans var. lacrymans S7.3]|uniref:Protein kinase domain-containing protein n=2 Tax=Serpula lacrymans var. lacrymans TaxID=341189 RepID=F8QFD5_SERL3|nr:uncharacterized protein SERLADRAFT_479287 [Serpula lacrymans var. lacrymans S7.9]EGN92919.1 hypothetical protein SERLA73DRAFT_190279 [Serpula lacrymans var. lacrymans S7.3]EGO19642.1 hypothetical protein SERLADRAFT_479287 [Serpula lacrymans var. lacrymans S7.9]
MSQQQVMSPPSPFNRGEIYPTFSASYEIYRGTINNKPVFAQTCRLQSPLQTREHLSDDFMQAFSKRLESWSKCNHPNIVTLIGHTLLEDSIPTLFIPTYKNGFAHDYLLKNPSCDRLRLVSGIAKGLQYLHAIKSPIVHQDMRCQNILVDDNGEGCLTAVGTRFMFKDPLGHSVHWTAPEVLRSRENDDNDDVEMTPPSDVYSFGMTVLEIYSGRLPFHEKNSCQVLLDALNPQGNRKLKRSDYPSPPDDIWRLITKCTSEEPSQRPTMDEVIRDLTAC